MPITLLQAIKRVLQNGVSTIDDLFSLNVRCKMVDDMDDEVIRHIVDNSLPPDEDVFSFEPEEDGCAFDLGNDVLPLEAILDKGQSNLHTTVDKPKEEQTPRHDFISEEILHALKANEDGDAWLYIEAHCGRFAYDYSTDQWHYWKGHYWHEDTSERAMAAIKVVIDVYRQEAGRQSQQRTQAERAGQTAIAQQHKAHEGALSKRIQALQGVKRKTNVLKLASIVSTKYGYKSLALTGREWDQNPMLLGCRNGVIDLETGIHRPGKSEDWIKTITPTEWQGTDAPAPTWERFLNEIFGNNAELIAYVQRLFGYAITGKTTQDIFPMLYGQGRNGKGTLLETLRYVLGGLAGPIEAEMLLAHRWTRQSEGPTSDIMSLRGKRLVWASETQGDRHLDTGRVKWLTGGDTLTGQAPHGKRQVSLKSTHKLFLLTNHKPHAPAHDYGFWKRLQLIPFTFSFADNPQKDNERKADKGLPEKLRAEASGILAWLVRGCLEWQEKGLRQAETVKWATKEYRESEDDIGRFIKSDCVTGPEYSTKFKGLYDAFELYCAETGSSVPNQKVFGQYLRRRFGEPRRKATGFWYIGIGLNRVKDGP